MRKLGVGVVMVLSAVFSGTVWADAAQDKGLQIAKAQYQKDRGFKDYTNNIVMTLKNAQGQETVDYLHSLTLEVDAPGEGDESELIFDRPADVKGTAMLTYSHGLKPNDQWLFLPAVKRVKRLASSNQSGPFMGSEFAYEDLSSFVVEKYSYTWLRDEACGQWQCFVVDRKPLYEGTGYTHEVVWVDKQEYRTVKIDFYDRKNELLKTLNQTGFKQYEGKYWRAALGTMVNHENGKSTAMASDNFKFGVGLTGNDFKPDVLQDAH